MLANPSAVQAWDQPGHRVLDLQPLDPSSYGLLSVAPAVSYQRTHGCYPAADAAIACAVEGALLDFDTALAVEGRYLTELVLGQVSKNMISAFWFQLNEINAGGSRPQGYARTSVRRIGVLGAGMMGAGIAHVSAQALQFINSVGPAAFVARADFLADVYGERFRPPTSLRELAAKGEQYVAAAR